ncbi:MAG: hypothetical protein L6Q60_04790 [Rhodocyclaceae bacterium]|nr:hypothetical protein [Rhodocyclaceae bacterium]
MRAPKILPWIAKRAGIGEALALKLWRRAVGEAELIVGNRDSSDFYRLSVERFINLAEEEVGRCPITGAANVTWLWRHQARMATLGLIAAESTYRLWNNNWNDFCAKQKIAA